MSYVEYLDLFTSAQKKKCPYRAFTFDVVNSKNQPEYISQNTTHYECLEYVYTLLELEEKTTQKEILLRDKYNRKYFDVTQISNGNNCNPMILGDMVTYFVRDGSITTERMLELFSSALHKFNISYPFHFQTGVYETNDYGEGGIKLYKGYMPQILENLSKNAGSLVSRESFFLDEEMETN